MNNISVNYNGRNLVFSYRDTFRKTNDIKKNIDLQTIQELYNENVYRLESGHLRGSRIVIDAGGHIGTFSVMAAAMGASKVIALEPNPDNLALLAINAANNNFENVIVPVPYALWSSKTVLDVDNFYSDSRVERMFDLESEVSKQVTRSEGQDHFKASTITLDELLEQHAIEQVDVLKVDIEWSEYEVIPSWSDETMQKIKYLCIEFHGTSKEIFGSLVAHLTRQFRLEILGSFERGGFIWCMRY